MAIIEVLLYTNVFLYILDQKNSDLADLEMVLPNFYHVKEEMIECVNDFYGGTVQRSEELKQYLGYKTDEHYVHLLSTL
ncbi:hypothetical protein BZK37_17805 [Enterococcus casseliflavus]|nr:hypothetical protein BZK37_17805 [Enterococcus casseliflavus]